MRQVIARFVLVVMFIAQTSGCEGSATWLVATNTSPVGASFNAFVVQPVNPIFVTPAQPFIIVIQLVPIGGFILGPPIFFNTFFTANPFLISSCPSLVVVGTPTIGTVLVGGVPQIFVPVTPIGVGTCAIPINLGIGGVISLNVQIGQSHASSNARQYVVWIHQERQRSAARMSSASHTLPSERVTSPSKRSTSTNPTEW
jgi:hypothetical protein